MTKKVEIPAQSLQIPKAIIITAKFLEAISPKLATLFAAKLFSTPLKHKIPKRELEMDKNALQQKILVPSLKKEIVVYQYGKGEKKILLVHGWSGRGTQLVKIADEFINLGFQTISFDAPAHGKSKGNSTLLTEFIAAILEIEKQFGPFEFAIGHSLGGMSILNAIKQNLKVKKAVIIGSGDSVQDIIDHFIKKLQLKPKYGTLLKIYFEKKNNTMMDSYSAYQAAKEVKIPILIIHDENDDEIPVNAAYHIQKHLQHSKIVITKGLGHRKILGDKTVIENIKSFLIN
jgi:pimeloyl-ACP methyl ester carboxylesterase